jgi:hypothetical protein
MTKDQAEVMNPIFVAHYGFEKTVFFFENGRQETAEGYCYRLRAIKAAREAQDAKYKALRKFIAR